MPMGTPTQTISRIAAVVKSAVAGIRSHTTRAGGLVLERLAEVAARHAVKKDEVLLEERLVQAKLPVELIHRGLWRPLGQQHPRRVSRDHAQDDEDKHGHAEKREARVEQSPQDVARHARDGRAS